MLLMPNSLPLPLVPRSRKPPSCASCKPARVSGRGRQRCRGFGAHSGVLLACRLNAALAFARLLSTSSPVHVFTAQPLPSARPPLPHRHQTGSEGCRRLAARLVPRYARRFPQHCDPTAEALISLAKLSLTGESLTVLACCRCCPTVLLISLLHSAVWFHCSYPKPAALQAYGREVRLSGVPSPPPATHTHTHLLPPTDPEQTAAARCDAAVGLPEVAAAVKGGGASGQQATIKLVAFCFE